MLGYPLSCKTANVLQGSGGPNAFECKPEAQPWPSNSGPCKVYTAYVSAYGMVWYGMVEVCEGAPVAVSVYSI